MAYCLSIGRNIVATSQGNIVINQVVVDLRSKRGGKERSELA